jgi:glyoxylase-like metal-dependent hydrolase (beta-lactamase superfamily II)
VERDRAFSRRLMASHGVPRDVIDGSEEFWAFHRANGAATEVDVRLSHGDRIRAGGRELEVLARPGHSPTDTLFVDAAAGLAFVGDHLLAGISSNTEISPVAVADARRPRPRTEYLDNLRRTAAMPLSTLLTGHGRPIKAHRALVDVRLDEHRRRAARIAAALARGPRTAYAIAGQLWSPRTLAEQPLLVVWEVLGHLETLVSAGRAVEVADDGRRRFALASAASASSCRRSAA